MPSPDFKKLFAESFNAEEFTSSLKDLFKNVVSDVSDPAFQKVLKDLAASSVDVVQLKVMNADQKLIDEAVASTKALGQTAINIPGLIAANKQAAFLSLLSNAGQALINFGLSVLKAYVGMPVAAASSAASVISKV
jgi:hypothetical protein